ncbi:MAG: hypothetical protein CL748_06670 [Chloroflexi bacterium]|nr:hypothetical protein [Chloroflexota bacterium]
MNDRYIEITNEEIDFKKLYNFCKEDHLGAVNVFFGVTRNVNNAKKVLYLEYESYKNMAEKIISKIIDEMINKWDIYKVAISHRSGRVDIGQISMVLVISSMHRKSSISATDYFIDRLKEIVPIWKKEFYEDGESWLSSTPG